MSALPSPKESPSDILGEELTTLIRQLMGDLLGKCNPDGSGFSTNTLDFGFSLLSEMIKRIVVPREISEATLDALSWGDGAVDLPQLVAQNTKDLVLNVIAESRTHLQGS